MRKLTQDTLIPISFALSLIGGGTMYITRVASAVESHEARLIEGKRRYEQQMDKLADAIAKIEKNISEINGELKRIRR